MIVSFRHLSVALVLEAAFCVELPGPHHRSVAELVEEDHRCDPDVRALFREIWCGALLSTHAARCLERASFRVESDALLAALSEAA